MVERSPKIIEAKVLTAFILGLSAALLGAAEVEVTLQPQSFPTDRGAQLSVVVSGGSFDETPIPEVPDGVSIRPYGQNRSIQIINGRMTRSLTQNYIITVDQPGNYTIPSFKVKVGGQVYDTQPVKFQVTAAGAPAAPPSGNARGRGGGGGTSPDAPPESLGFLRLDFPPREREHLFVGEMAPVRIKAYFPADTRVSLRSAPRPDGQGFTLHNLSEQPEQRIEQFKGKTWRTVTWFAGVSMAKAGDYPVTVSLDATVMVRESAPRQRSRRPSFGGGLFDDFFGDDFFDDFFDSAMVRTVPREVSLTSQGDALEVRSLPGEGRPDHFTGAVGKFEMRNYQLPAEGTVGEPQKVRVTIGGEGNFDRLGAPVMLPSDTWKTYSPKTEFEAADVASFAGKKTFEFNAVPRKGGPQEVSLAFSYFDPETGRYEEVESQKIRLNVSGVAVEEKDSQSSEGAAAANPPESAVSPSPPDPAPRMAPARAVPGTTVTSLSPLIHRPFYWGILTTIVLVLGVAIALGKWRERRTEPRRVAERLARANETAAVAEAGVAAKRGDAVAFFQAARRALQERYGFLWGRPAEAITLSDLRQRLNPEHESLEIFARADALAYGGSPDEELARLKDWEAKLREILDSESLAASHSGGERGAGKKTAATA